MNHFSSNKNALIKIFNEKKESAQVYNYFSVVEKTIIDRKTFKWETIDFDQTKFSDYYRDNKLIEIDPIIDFLKFSNREIILFEELEFKETIAPTGKIFKPGKIINEVRANGQFSMYNGFYTIHRINEKIIISMYGLDSLHYDISNFFNFRKPDGNWFINYQKSCEEIIKKVLLNYEM